MTSFSAVTFCIIFMIMLMQWPSTNTLSFSKKLTKTDESQNDCCSWPLCIKFRGFWKLPTIKLNLFNRNQCEVQCDSGQGFRNDDTVICVYNNVSVTFDIAKQDCEGKNMNLLKIADEQKREFVFDGLAKVDPSSKDTAKIYYIGLHRNSPEEEYKWTDGSLLGDYHPWIFAGTQTRNCVTIWVGTQTPYNEVYWNDLECNGSFANYHELYYMCEKNLTI